MQEMIVTALNKVDIDIRTPLYQHVLLSGGNTLFMYIQEKLHSEIKKLAPKYMKIKLHTPSNRKHICWSGGSIITSLDSFNQMWVSRSDYMEKGEKEIYIKTI
jgi:actin-related protein